MIQFCSNINKFNFILLKENIESKDFDEMKMAFAKCEKILSFQILMSLHISFFAKYDKDDVVVFLLS